MFTAKSRYVRMMEHRSHAWRLALMVLCVMTVCGCVAIYRPVPTEEVPFQDRAQTKSDGHVRVRAAALSAKESKKLFRRNIARRGIQPVWLEIENRDDEEYWFFVRNLDPDYFSPAEAAYKSRYRWYYLGSSSANRRMFERFDGERMRLLIPAGTIFSGMVYTHLEMGTKEVLVELVGEGKVKSFTFFLDIPGFKADHHVVDFEGLYPKDEIVSYDEEGLRSFLEQSPCCTTNKKGTRYGDPLNIVVIGDVEAVWQAFIRSGWDETELIGLGSTWKTLKSFSLGKKYMYAPVSSLYVFGRRQDIALQKARETIHERNHLRLWLTPARFRGMPVWIGQISRDIGILWTLKGGKIVTHKIDPDVDETREYLLQDLLASGRVAGGGFVKGVGAVPPSEPRKNLAGDTYYTDGLRVVFVLSDEPISYDEIELFKWEQSPER